MSLPRVGPADGEACAAPGAGAEPGGPCCACAAAAISTAPAPAPSAPPMNWRRSTAAVDSTPTTDSSDLMPDMTTPDLMPHARRLFESTNIAEFQCQAPTLAPIAAKFT